ncbi:hypothetical protein C8A03DRAFT_34487 [Achaetomium macrosporum]|uniref:Uncharacterized protein n=1 Tax=Achaetomium macrosporum TaxID=79813 RepID=A0AAN7CA01_9PEZI|nr:hypothetical protein C8A03DRAFT_34487 [Achaetomium macrosporum]
MSVNATWNIAYSPQGWDWLSRVDEASPPEPPVQTTTNNLNSPTRDDDGGSSSNSKAATSTKLVSMSSQAHQQAQKQQTPQPHSPRISGRRREYETPDKKVYYICDDCGVTVGFYANEKLRCMHCGGRTMKKPRIKGVSQFAAV